MATLSALPQQVAQVTGFKIVSHRLDFYGICPRCQEKGESAPVSRVESKQQEVMPM
jgi:Fur family peroxide stress response transcriptional regulator